MRRHLTHDREIARIVLRDPSIAVLPQEHVCGSRLTEIDWHELRSAASIDELLADERDR